MLIMTDTSSERGGAVLEHDSQLSADVERCRSSSRTVARLLGQEIRLQYKSFTKQTVLEREMIISMQLSSYFSPPGSYLLRRNRSRRRTCWLA